MGIVTKGVGKKQKAGCIWNSIQRLRIAVAIRSSPRCLIQGGMKMIKDAIVRIFKTLKNQDQGADST